MAGYSFPKAHQQPAVEYKTGKVGAVILFRNACGTMLSDSKRWIEHNLGDCREYRLSDLGLLIAAYHKGKRVGELG